MASPRIQVLIDGSAEGLQRAVAKARKQLGDLEDKLDNVGGKRSRFGQLGDAASNLAGQHLGPLGDAADALGVQMGGISGPQAAAAAGMVALGTAAVASIRQFTDLADRVRSFSAVTGMTAFESSRLIANMDDLGISTESAQGSFSRLARNIDAGKLDEYGIAVVRTKDGSVNMAATLGNVADAIAGTTDPTKRATMGNDLLGRSYADLLPLLNKGSQGMAEFADSVSKAQTLSEDDLAASRNLQVSLDELKESGSDLGLTFAKETVPALALMTADLAKASGAVSGATGGLVSFADAAAVGVPVLGGLFNLYSQRAKNAKDATADLAAEKQRLADQQAANKSAAEEELRLTKEQEAAERTLVTQINNRRKAQQDLTKALDDKKAAVAGLADKELAEWRAQQKFSEALDALANGTGDYSERLADAADAALRTAAAEVELGKQRSIAAGKIPSIDESLRIEREAYANLLAKATDPNLREWLQKLIDRIDGITTASAALQQAINNAGGLSNYVSNYAELGIAAPLPGRASGGPVRSGQAYVVGENGPEVLLTGSSSGTIVPNGALTAQRGATINNITITTAADPNAVVAAVKQYIRQNGSTPW